MLESPYFEPRITTEDPNEFSSGFDLKTEDGPVFFSLHDTTSTSGAQSSSINEQDFTNRAPESCSAEISSACSGKIMNLDTSIESESIVVLMNAFTFLSWIIGLTCLSY